MSLDILPCSLKERFDRRATEELRLISDQEERDSETIAKRDRATTIQFFGKQNLAAKVKGCGLSIMYKLLENEDDIKTLSNATKTPIAPWQVCSSIKQHKNGYQLDMRENFPTRKNGGLRKDSEHFPARISTKEYESESFQPQAIKDVRVQHELFHIEGSSLQHGVRFSRNNRFSAPRSPHDTFRFHHFKNSGYYIKHYKEQITDMNIKKHMQLRLQENAVRKKSVKKPSEKSTKSCFAKPSFMVYRFCISKEGRYSGSGILKVGPCPGMEGQKEKEQDKKREENRDLTSKKSMLVDKFKVDACKAQKSTTKIKVNSDRSRRKNNYSTTLVVQGKSENNINPCGSQSGERKLKNVELSFQKTLTGATQQTANRANKSKHLGRPLGQPLKFTWQSTRNGAEIPKVRRRPTLGEREFLRITTPKPLIRTCSLTPSDLDESPSISRDKSLSVSPVRSPVQINSRNQLIAEILMNREPQAVFPKNSNFQACITPSNYSTSSVESRIRHRKDLTLEEGPDQDQSLNDAQNHNEDCYGNVTAKRNVGPFISG